MGILKMDCLDTEYSSNGEDYKKVGGEWINKKTNKTLQEDIDMKKLIEEAGGK